MRNRSSAVCAVCLAAVPAGESTAMQTGNRQLVFCPEHGKH